MAAESLSTSRIEAFSDGVFAVIITIMVLELKVPALHDVSDKTALLDNVRIGLVYLLSFVQVGIYWVNHHYLLDDLETISHGVLWANLVALFALSFVPFGLQWIGSRGIRPVPVAIYAFCYLMPAVGWGVLARTVQHRTAIPAASGTRKQVLSCVLCASAILVAFRSPWAALLLDTFVALLWLIPPSRIVEKSRALKPQQPASNHSA